MKNPKTIFVCVGLVFSASWVAADERHYGDWSKNAKVIAYAASDIPPGRLGAAMICLDGYRFAVAGMLGHGSASAPSVAITQVFANQQGESVPASCE